MAGCAAQDCRNSYDKGYLMRRFPRDPQRRNEWVRNVARGSNWLPAKHASLCEVHFAPEMWEQRRLDNKPKLKPNAVPTRFGSAAKERTFVRVKQNKQNVFEGNENGDTVGLNINYSVIDDIQNNEDEFILPDQSENFQQIATPLQTSSGVMNNVQEVVIKVEEENESLFISSDQLENYQDVTLPSGDLNNEQQRWIQLQEERVVMKFEEECDRQFIMPDNSENYQQLSASFGDINNVQEKLIKVEEENERLFILPYQLENFQRMANPLQSSPGDINNVQTKLTKLEEENARQSKEIERLSKAFGGKQFQLMALRKALKSEKDNVRTLKERINNDRYKLALCRIFTDDQVQSLIYDRTPWKWSTETIKRALEIKRTCGVHGYELLRKQKIPLPDLRTIRRFLQSNRSQPNESECTSDFLELSWMINADEERECIESNPM